MEKNQESATNEEQISENRQVSDDFSESSRPKNPKKMSANATIFGFFIFLLVLIFAFYGTLMWGFLDEGASNPLLGMLGLNSSELKNTLLGLTNTIFGILALVFLLSTLVKIFQYSMATRGTGARRGFFVKSIVFLTLFLVICSVWFTSYWMISTKSVDPNSDARNIGETSSNPIVTTPKSVIGLSAPAQVVFDIGERLFSQIDRNLISQIQWDFDGDGEFDASGSRVIHRFVNRGRFTVSATVSYFSPEDQSEKKYVVEREVIISNESVRGAISANPESGTMPLAVEFSAAESVDPDGQVVLYEWDFDGDGEFEVRGDDKISVSREFTEVGTFVVKLRVTGTNNDTNEVEKTITVSAPEESLRAVIASNEGFEGASPLKITLDGSNSYSKIGQIVRYEWKVSNEAKPVIGRRISRVFREPGEYAITLTVVNDLGNRSQTTEKIHVLADPTKTKLIVRTTPSRAKNGEVRGKVPLEVSFDASSSAISSPVEWAWDFDGDGQFDEFGSTTSWVFRSAGNFSTKLKVTNSDGQWFAIEIPVVVDRAGIVAKISADPISGNVPLVVSFDGSGSSSDSGKIINYIWKFPGQNPIHYGAKISYEFRQVGVFPVGLKVLTSDGQSGEAEILISARSTPLEARFQASATRGSAPLRVEFDPAMSTGTITRYFWDFGDGESSDKFRPTHIFKSAGNFTVKLKIANPQGVISEFVKTIFVEK